MLSKLGPELTILRDTPLVDIEKVGGSLLCEGVLRMRNGNLHIAPGYDGEFGTVHIFNKEERNKLNSQNFFF